MPRAKRSPPRDKATAIAQFAEHHILDVRLGQRGQVQKVKHVAFGWMDPKDYYLLQEFHAALPIIGMVIQGGYQFNQAIYGLEVSALSVNLPLGPALITFGTTVGLAMVGQGIQESDPQKVLLGLGIALAPVLPFGALLIVPAFLYAGGAVSGLVTGPWEAVGSGIQAVLASPDVPQLLKDHIRTAFGWLGLA